MFVSKIKYIKRRLRSKVYVMPKIGQFFVEKVVLECLFFCKRSGKGIYICKIY